MNSPLPSFQIARIVVFLYSPNGTKDALNPFIRGRTEQNLIRMICKIRASLITKKRICLFLISKSAKLHCFMNNAHSHSEEERATQYNRKRNRERNAERRRTINE